MRRVIPDLVQALGYEISEVARQGHSVRIELSNGTPRDTTRAAAPGVSVVRYRSATSYELPPDTYGKLITKQSSFDASVIEVLPGSVVLAVEHPHGGVYGALSGRFEADSTFLLSKLQDVLIQAQHDAVEANWDLLDKLMGYSKAVVAEDPEAIITGLNPEQAKATRRALGSEVLFVQGPPGTGKTHTISNIVRSAMQQKRRIMVASHTHVAVDQALIAALRGLDQNQRRRLVRVGLPRLSEIPDDVVTTNSDTDFVSRLHNAGALFCTLSKRYADPTILELRFELALLDEVSMANLALALPTIWGASDAVVMIGDPHQLPPIVQSEAQPAKKWLGTDVFEHSRATSRPAFTKLIEQRRMRPPIASICRELRYGPNDLSDHDSVRSRPLSPAAKVLGGHALILLDSSPGTGSAVHYDGSYFNLNTAVAAVDTAVRISRQLPAGSGDRERPIGIVTPYARQRRLLTGLCSAAGILDTTLPGTVHTFQGNEVDVAIFDPVLVKGHTAPRLVLKDEGTVDEVTRLLNVAVSRARDQFIAVGDVPWFRIMPTKSGLGSLMKSMSDAHRIDWSPDSGADTWETYDSFEKAIDQLFQLKPDDVVVTGNRHFAESVVPAKRRGIKSWVVVANDRSTRAYGMPGWVRWIPWAGSLPNSILTDAGVVASANGSKWTVIRDRALGRVIAGVFAISDLVTHVQDRDTDEICPLCSSDLVAEIRPYGTMKGRALFSCPRYPDCKGTLVTPRWTPRDRVASESAHGSATGEGNQLHRQDEQERKRKRAERKAKVEKRKREGRPVARNRGSLPSPDRVNTRQSPRRTCENCGEDYPKRWERCGSCNAENPERRR